MNVNNDYTSQIEVLYFMIKIIKDVEIGRLALVYQNAVRPTKPRTSVLSCKFVA